MNQFRQFGEDIVLGPQPSREDLDEARRRGIRSVIDLRMAHETPTDNRALAEQSGMQYASIPVDKNRLSPDQLAALDRALAELPGPHLIHCASGARAALLLCVSEARRLGWNADETFEKAKSLGFDLQNSPEMAEFVRRSVAQ